jgi:hypothetical protein
VKKTGQETHEEYFIKKTGLHNFGAFAWSVTACQPTPGVWTMDGADFASGVTGGEHRFGLR